MACNPKARAHLLAGAPASGAVQASQKRAQGHLCKSSCLMGVSRREAYQLAGGQAAVLRAVVLGADAAHALQPRLRLLVQAVLGVDLSPRDAFQEARRRLARLRHHACAGVPSASNALIKWAYTVVKCCAAHEGAWRVTHMISQSLPPFFPNVISGQQAIVGLCTCTQRGQNEVFCPEPLHPPLVLQRRGLYMQVRMLSIG